MSLSPNMIYLLVGGGAFVFVLLIMSVLGSDAAGDLQRRLARVGPDGSRRKINTRDRGVAPGAVRKTIDSGIPFLNRIVHLMPNPDNLRARIARTGKELSLGEYLLINAVVILFSFALFNLLGWAKIIAVPLCVAVGFGLPHFVIGHMGNRRIKKFLATFPEAIDTMCRGLRSGLPITESIGAVGREMPDPIGIEFHRISDGIRMGKSLENAMWEVSRRIDTPEYRFLIIAMAIQKETGGNLAETLGNLADLIRKRRQLRMKVKAMSSEAKASAMIIGSLPFIMFTLLLVVNSEYIMTLFHVTKGKFMMAGAAFWMSLGWVTMTKMINFEL